MKRMILLATAMLLATVIGAGAQTATATLDRYDIALVDLDEALVRIDADGGQQRHTQAYLVRLHGTFPAATARLMELRIGETRIEEYGSFPGGIYFMVFTKAKLDALSGKKIGWRLGNGIVQWFAPTFDPERFAPFKAMPEKDAMTRE